MADRNDFLLRMYEQMFKDIAQAYTVVWQSAATVFASFVAITLSDKGIVPLDVAVSIVILVVSWFYLNIIECSYWYNRNMGIISNIERQFLIESDQKDIVYYFGSHRPTNKMINHLKNQTFLAIGLAALVFAYHFWERIRPGLCLSMDYFEPLRALPYITGVASTIFIVHRQKGRNESYSEFLRESPGKKIDTSSVKYGPGHGHAK